MGKKSDNKFIKEKMINIFGSECFIEKLKLRKNNEINEVNGVREYKGKIQMKIMKLLTYHHIEERSNGGKSTVGNGALLSNENHAWFNQQSKKEQKKMNKEFQKYKLSFLGLSVSDEGIDIEKLINDTVNSRDLPKEFLDGEISLEDSVIERGEDTER